MAEKKWWEKYSFVSDDTKIKMRAMFDEMEECRRKGIPYDSGFDIKMTTPEHDAFMHEGGAYFLPELLEIQEEKRRKCGGK